MPDVVTEPQIIRQFALNVPLVPFPVKNSVVYSYMTFESQILLSPLKKKISI